MIYHVLPEVEPFSEYAGGALSCWVANIVRSDDARVVCPWADDSWVFDQKRLLPMAGMRLYGRLLKSRDFRIRIAHRVRLLRWLLRPLERRLKDGDVLYIHNRPEYVLALPPAAKRKSRYKVVLHMHNDHLANLTVPERAALRPDLTVFNSKFLEQQGRRLAGNLLETAVLYNGADESCFYPRVQATETLPLTVLFVGRLIPEKGVHVLVEAMRLLQQQGSTAVARIVGSVSFGDDRGSEYLERLQANAPSNVRFIRYKAGKALADEFREAAVFCCPSLWEEPFGMVNVEAMASALPVVATNTGGIPEIFSEGGAILVPRDSIEALATALQRLMLEPALRRQMAREGLASYQRRFRWSLISAEYRGLMSRLQEESALPVAVRVLPGLESLKVAVS